MSRWVVLVLIVGAVLCDDNIATKYKCGSECDEKQMDSSDPTADAMPHTFGSHIPLSPKALATTMNSYASEAAAMAPPAHAAGMPGSVGGVGLKSMPASAQIPYEPVDDKPALRRPCNLDEVMQLLRQVKQDYQSEDEHDTKLHEHITAGLSPLSSAKSSLDEAEQRVKDLLAAKEANETLTNVMSTIALKSVELEDVMKEKAELILYEGTLKNPILKSIGRTNINLQGTIAAKEAALNDLASHPAFTKEEMSQVLTTYDELIISIKKQLTQLHKEASDVLTPIQLNINQTEHSIEALKSEIRDLEKEQSELVPTAEKYSPVALDSARAIAADALAHFNAEKESQSIDLKAFDQRSSDRSSIIHLVDQMLLLVSDIQQPQDPSDEFVESRTPQSLAGSVPVKPSVSA